MSPPDTRDRVRVDGIAATLLGEALTFNADAPDEELATDAQYVILTPHQAERVHSFFASHGGHEEAREDSTDSAKSRSFMRAMHQAGIATEAAAFVADALPEDDPRQEKAARAADLIGEVSSSLSTEHQDAVETQDEER